VTLPRLLTLLALTAGLSAAVTTASAAPVLRTAAPVVHRGQAVRISVATLSTGVCLAEVRYADGAVQDSGIKTPSGRRVSWTIRVPNNAMPGLARWSVRCGASFNRSGNWRVVATAAASTAPKVLIDRQGYTQRNDQYGTGSSVSYGLLLKNASTTQDAKNVYLLVNFVAASGELIASASKNLTLIAAGQTFGFGDNMTLRTQVPVAKLEVTIKVMAHEPAKKHVLPHFVNVRILPSETDPGYVGEIDGEIVNDTSPATLTYTNLSIVILDAGGKIVGGGNSIAYAALPSGSRMVFIANSGFAPIPAQQAVTPIISADPTYQNN
jgi:hypothetical protein